MKIISLVKITGALQRCLHRFPVVVLFTIALTFFLLWRTWNGFLNDRLALVVLYYLSVGSLLSLSLELWAEEVKWRTALVAKVTAYVLLTMDAFYLYYLPKEGFNMEIFLAHAACISTLSISVFLLPFFREKDDIPAWNFTWQLIGTASASLLAGVVMWGGVALLSRSLETLFGWEVCNEVFQSIPTFCLQLLPTLIFLGLIPEGDAKHNRTGYVSTFINKVVRFLFLPLLGGYLVVLYAYAAKILIQWQLPDGWVSGLVVALMAGCIVIEFLIYPANKESKHSTFEQQVVRWLPLLILPLLVLMTVGIGRRIDDYGITLRRLYLLTLNFWFYGVCIGLFVCRARRIHWIPLSLSALFVLTSVFPVNYVDITHRYLYNKVCEKIRATYQGAFPMSEETYFNWLTGLDPDDALLVNSRLDQLKDIYQDKRIEAFIGNHANFWGAKQLIMDNKVKASKVDSSSEEEVTTYDYIYICYEGTLTFPIPQGVDSLSILQSQDISQKISRPLPDTLRIALPATTGIAHDSICVSFADLKKWSNLRMAVPRELTCTLPNAHFVLTGCNLNFRSEKMSGTVSGYYYKKIKN